MPVVATPKGSAGGARATSKFPPAAAAAVPKAAKSKGQLAAGVFVGGARPIGARAVAVLKKVKEEIKQEVKEEQTDADEWHGHFAAHSGEDLNHAQFLGLDYHDAKNPSQTWLFSQLNGNKGVFNHGGLWFKKPFWVSEDKKFYIFYNSCSYKGNSIAGGVIPQGWLLCSSSFKNNLEKVAAFACSEDTTEPPSIGWFCPPEADHECGMTLIMLKDEEEVDKSEFPPEEKDPMHVEPVTPICSSDEEDQQVQQQQQLIVPPWKQKVDKLNLLT